MRLKLLARSWVCLILAMVFGGVGCGSSREGHEYVIKTHYGTDDPQFRRSVGSLLGSPIVGGNTVTSLRNGDEIFPAMLEAIRNAKKTINCETFIYWSGDVGSQFTEALCERSKAGVKVRLIIDAIGSLKIDQQFHTRLKDCGVKLVEYHPVSWYNFDSDSRLNNRTHRKLLIVDGTVGFTGGVGIADEWSGHAQDEKHWRDMHYRVTGPVVAELQAAFLDNWMKTTGEVLHDVENFPPLTVTGDNDTQVFKSGASGGAQNMQLLFLLSMAAARQNIRIGNAYFVPDDLTIDSLIDARNRGVRVQIITPGPHLDAKTVRHASQAKWGKLLESGVEIYEYQPTMYHTKLLIIDNQWVSVGSSNLDNRSFQLNDEANLNVLNESFAKGEIKVFEDDLIQSKPMTYEDWKNRPLWDRFKEGFARIISPLL